MCVLFMNTALAQDYFLKTYEPFDENVPSPEKFLGYAIGDQHTRHDQIVSYFELLAERSDKAVIEVYGHSHEGRKLIMLTISAPDNLKNLESIQQAHLRYTDPNLERPSDSDIPIIINLGYGVHGNEPSSAEAAMLAAYTLIASQNSDIQEYVKNAVVFVDPVINPDGRDRHTQWANQYRSKVLVSDSYDAEHREAWPRGRTNHYWFDLNRDWLLAVNPESQSKLNWIHQWYPNVVTDFHEMGTNSNYFFEPMKPIGSQVPLMPKENYEDLNELFATYYSKALDDIGSFYYTKESFDGTYPGYGSSYPDLQGGLALLFEQASSRGHVQETAYGDMTFAFTIRNQYATSMATVQAAVENKSKLRAYQYDFFKSAVNDLPKKGVAGYEFGDVDDRNRTKEFVDKLLTHKINVYKKGERFVVPMKQKQRRMVQTVFETYSKYRDSVFYDASAWSLVNFFNMPYRESNATSLGEQLTSTEQLVINEPVVKSDYAYLIDWNDYYSPAALYYLQKKGIKLASAFKTFEANTNNGPKKFDYGTLLIPVSKQKKTSDEVYETIRKAQLKFNIPVSAVNSGYSLKGIDLGSNNFRALKKAKPALLIGDGVSSYEAGEVWHLLDTRFPMPLTKIMLSNFSGNYLDKYNTLIMVSGSYRQLDSVNIAQLKQWVSKGNTLITIAGASSWAIRNKLVSEKLVKNEPAEKQGKRLSYGDAGPLAGKERIGGSILRGDLDLTHPLGFGYTRSEIALYKNNQVFLQPSKNPYSTVIKYNDDVHIDGFLSARNRNQNLKNAASLLVSSVGGGRVVLFADNPNFRGAWYGTNRLFLNALFLGNHINVPRYVGY